MEREYYQAMRTATHGHTIAAVLTDQASDGKKSYRVRLGNIVHECRATNEWNALGSFCDAYPETREQQARDVISVEEVRTMR